MAVDDAHQAGLADEGGGGVDAGRGHVADEARRAEAADLLVIGESEMHGAPQRRFHEPRHDRQHAGDVALHVAGAASVESAFRFGEAKGIARPHLPVHGDDIGVSAQQEARGSGRPDGREEIGLALRPRQDGRRHAVTREVVAHPFDERQIGVAADRVEGDQPFKDGDRRAGERAHGVVSARAAVRGRSHVWRRVARSPPARPPG